MAKPLGTFTPCAPSSRYISPSEAFLPPTSGRSPSVIWSNQRMNSGIVHLAATLLRARLFFLRLFVRDELGEFAHFFREQFKQIIECQDAHQRTLGVDHRHAAHTP